jgi:hypothetical protein
MILICGRAVSWILQLLTESVGLSSGRLLGMPSASGPSSYPVLMSNDFIRGKGVRNRFNTSIPDHFSALTVPDPFSA